MDDPVADVLSERSSIESGAAAAVVLSIVAHAGISAVAVWAAMHRPPTQTAMVMNIRFAQMKPVAAPVAKPQPVAPVVAAPAPVVTAPKAEPKPVAKPVEASPFGKSLKKETPLPPAPVVAAAPAVVTSTQPEVAIEGGDFPYTVYIDRMKTLIGGRWFRPQAGAATVKFTIDRDGSIHDAVVETQSGNGTFDRAALRAVLESSPLPPLPFGYSGTYLVVRLTFR